MPLLTIYTLAFHTPCLQHPCNTQNGYMEVVLFLSISRGHIQRSYLLKVTSCKGTVQLAFGIIACRWFTSEVCGELNKQHVHTANLQQARMQVQTNLPRHIERSLGEWEGLKCVSCEEGNAWALFFQPWHLLCVIRLIMWSWWLSSSAEMGSGLCLEAIQAQGWTPDWGNQRRMRVAH